MEGEKKKYKIDPKLKREELLEKIKNNEKIKFIIEHILKNIAEFLFSYPPRHDMHINGNKFPKKSA